MNGFQVYLNGKFYDEVFFSKSMTCDDVKLALIKEGMSDKIVVKSFRV